MWDLQMSHPFGRLSMRSILLFVTSLIVTVFAYIFIATPSAYAADATWKGKSIVYDSHQYTSTGPASVNDGTNLKPETQVYQYIDAPNTSTGAISAPQKDHVIYFDPGVDPTTATSATYVEYDFTPPKTYTNKTSIKTITLDRQDANNQGATSCDSTFTFGIGWVVCPVTNFLSGAMDWLFQILTGFLTVRPAQTGQENALYRAWSYMRNFANIAFVIAFLFLIYSQLTSLGLSNYGIKKMLPRLIIAAVLVNISYWICAIAIDISNILGYSIQDIFISMRNSIIGGSGNSWDVVSWKSIGGFILSGGTALFAAGVGIHALIAGSVGSAIFLLLPILAGALLSVLVALLVMAARQAIITILVIIAPLAFVAYILPNTEKYFEKWRETFMTLLLVFPMFSVVFGGAQLAGIAIIQNADSINLILLGMAIQVAPVAITPLLIRFGGGLLSHFTGIVNNPGKGMVDRTRKWSQERADEHKDKVLANPKARGLNKRTQNINARRRDRKEWQKVHQARADNIYRGRDMGLALDEATRDAQREKQILDNTFESNWNIKAHLDTSSIKRELELQITGDEAARAKERVATMQKEFQTGVAPGALSAAEQNSATMLDMLNRSQDTAQDLALTAMRKQSAEGVHKSHIAKALLKNTDRIDGKLLQDYAGGIDEHGANSALATAVSIDRKQYADRVDEASAILKHFNINGKQRQEHAMGQQVRLVDSAGNVKVLEPDSTFTREAAIEAQLGGAGNMENIEEIIMNSGGSLNEFKTTISAAIVKNGIANKGVYWGGKTIDDVAQGNINGEDSVKFVVTRAMAQGKIKPATLTTMDQLGVARIRDAIANPSTAGLGPEDAAALATEMYKLQASAYEAIHSETLRGNIAQNVMPLLKEIMGDYTPPANP